MKIRRIILKGVRNFTDFDHCFEDTWNGEVPDSLLLIGPNGSGKTTLLNIIAEMWQMLAEAAISLQGQESRKISGALILNDQVLIRNGYAAIEFTGLDAKSVWVISGSHNPTHNLISENNDSHRILVTLGVDDKGNRPYYWYSAPGSSEPIEINQFQLTESHSNWVTEWGRRLEENMLGKCSDMVNMVYLESEFRVLNKIKDRFQVTPEPESFRWLAKYEPTTSRKGSLQNYLYNLKVVDSEDFYRIIKSLNIFLVGKEIIDFSPKGELRVLVNSSYKHPIEDLSAGEKQVLLMLVTIHRWMQPGGIVLIDEPDLHLHVSLMNAFASHLRRMVAEKGGQLILASHAPELWQLFKESEIVRLGKFGMEENL